MSLLAFIAVVVVVIVIRYEMIVRTTYVCTCTCLGRQSQRHHRANHYLSFNATFAIFEEYSSVGKMHPPGSNVGKNGI